MKFWKKLKTLKNHIFRPKNLKILKIKYVTLYKYKAAEQILGQKYCIKLRTCWFHYKQATKRWLRNNGKSHFVDNSNAAFRCLDESQQNEIRKILRAIDRFVFLPQNQIKPLLQFLHEEASKNLDLNDFFIYRNQILFIASVNI